MAGVGLALGRVPEMMRDEFQRQRFGRRPGQGASGRGQRPGLEIGEIGGERRRLFSPMPSSRQMFERRDVVVGQKLGEPVAPVHRQDRGEGVELERAAGRRIVGDGQGVGSSWRRQGTE